MVAEYRCKGTCRRDLSKQELVLGPNKCPYCTGPIEPVQPIREYFAELRKTAPPEVAEVLDEYEEHAKRYEIDARVHTLQQTLGVVRTMDSEQRSRWLHVGSEERTKVMQFLMDDLGLTAVKTADFLVASPEVQEAAIFATFKNLAESTGISDSLWETVYEEQKAHEAIPVAFHRTFLTIWGTHSIDFDRISFL